MTKAYNVLFVTGDQWRAECLSALGHPLVRTPTLDTLAADGTLFLKHFANTSPCGPSRASIHTGLYAMTHRSVRNGTPLDARFDNWALALRRHGYDPSLVGYTDTSADPRRFPKDHPALRTYEGVLPGMAPLLLMPSDHAAWLGYLRSKGYDVPAIGPTPSYTPQASHPDAARRGPTYAPALYAAEHSDTAFSTDRALAHLSESRGSPWCLHLSYLRPHPPHVVPAPYHDRHSPDDVPDPRRATDRQLEASQHPWLAHHLGTQAYAADWPEPHRRQLRATYYGMIDEVDHQLGRVIGWLKASGEYDRTIILFTADHGEMLGDHWFFGKDGYFDAAFHVPMILRVPDGVRGRRVAAFTEHVDLMPTLLDLLGIPVPQQCDGRSLAPWLGSDTPADWRVAAHWEYDFRDVATGAPEHALGIAMDACCLAVHRGQRHKYVHFAALPGLLFDLEQDPQELIDRAADPAYATVLASCMGAMLSWRLRHAERTLAGIVLTQAGPIERR
ncbi:MAG: alkaline phosphatase family protein [Proteobacteria bacterium]|nr:alkaline phosphatase family protein [Pseudomonadota bacterium]MBI3499089.1 alkaline phosphatase family protein [Pseudomonadota bacterium]